jgi:hypothetical protein
MTSSTTHGSVAVKQCRFPYSGYSTTVSDEASRAASVFSFANRAPTDVYVFSSKFIKIIKAAGRKDDAGTI